MLVEFKQFTYNHIVKHKRKIESRIKVPLGIQIYNRNFYKKKEAEYLGTCGFDFIELIKEQREYKI